MNGTTDKPVDRPASPAEHSASTGVVPLAVWLAIQLAAICLSALQFRWTSRFPHPAEQWALHVLLAAQVAGSVLLFSILLIDWRRLIIAIVVTWPPLVLAGILAEATTGSITRAGGFIAVWLVGLWLWRTALRSVRLQLLATAILSTIVLGGPLLQYLSQEFSTTSFPFQGPIESAYALLGAPIFANALPPLILLLTGAIARLLSRSLPQRARAEEKNG